MKKSTKNIILLVLLVSTIFVGLSELGFGLKGDEYYYFDREKTFSYTENNDLMENDSIDLHNIDRRPQQYNGSYDYNSVSNLNLTQDPTTSINFSDEAIYDTEGYYYGTYDFNHIPDSHTTRVVGCGEYTDSDEAVDTIDFIDLASIPINTSVSIEKEVNGHFNVLNLTDNNNTDKIYLVNDFEDQIEGSIELYMYTDDFTKRGDILIQESASSKVFLYWDSSSNLKWYNGSDSFIVGSLLTDWNHIVIDFNCINNDFDVYLNNILSYENAQFIGDATTLNRLYFRTQNSYDDYSIYYDAIGYSWDDLSHNGLGYNEGMNSYSPTFGKGTYYGTYLGSSDNAPWYIGQEIDFAETTFGDSFDNLTITDFGGHKNVLNISDYSSSGRGHVKKSWSSVADNVMEFYVGKDVISTATQCNILIGEDGGAGTLISLQLEFDDIQYQSTLGGAWSDLKTNYLEIDKLVHFSFWFDDTNNDFDLLIDNDMVLEDEPFISSKTTTTAMNYIQFSTYNAHTDYSMYVSAFGLYSDDTSHDNVGYETGMNKNPYNILPYFHNDEPFSWYDNSLFESSAHLYNSSYHINKTYQGYEDVLILENNFTQSITVESDMILMLNVSNDYSFGLVSFNVNFNNTNRNRFSFYEEMYGSNTNYFIFEDNKLKYHIGAGSYTTIATGLSTNTWHTIEYGYDCFNDQGYFKVNNTITSYVDFDNDIDYVSYISLATAQEDNATIGFNDFEISYPLTSEAGGVAFRSFQNSTVRIYPEYDNHYNVLGLNDMDASTYADVIHEINLTTTDNGSFIEMYLAKRGNTDASFSIQFLEGDLLNNRIISSIRFRNDGIDYLRYYEDQYGGGATWIEIFNSGYINESLHHVKFGLFTNHLSINLTDSNEYIDEVDYTRLPLNQLRYFIIRTNGNPFRTILNADDDDFTVFVDGVGLTGVEGYTIGDNRLEADYEYEVDKYDFRINPETRRAYPNRTSIYRTIGFTDLTFATNVHGWQRVGTSANSEYYNMIQDTDENYIQLATNHTYAETLAVRRQIFYLSGIYRGTLDFEAFWDSDNAPTEWKLRYLLNIGGTWVGLQIVANIGNGFSVQKYDGTLLENITSAGALEPSIELNETRYSLEFFAYADGNGFYELYNDNKIVSSADFSLNNVLSGLQSIEIQNSLNGVGTYYQGVNIYSVGVYATTTGKSLCGGAYGGVAFEGLSGFDKTQQMNTLFTSYGSAAIEFIDRSFFDITSDTGYMRIGRQGSKWYSSYALRRWIYPLFSNLDFTSKSVWFTIKQDSVKFEIYEFHIETMRLKFESEIDNSVKYYYPTFNFENNVWVRNLMGDGRRTAGKVFWIDMNDKLHYTLHQGEDIYATISMSFDIDVKSFSDVAAIIPRKTITTTDSYDGYYGDDDSYYVLKDNTSNYLGLQLGNGSTVYFRANQTYQNEPYNLTQGAYMNGIEIRISGNEQFKTSKGYYEYVKLRDPSWLTGQIEILGLLIALPILIMLLIPTYLLYVRFGKVVILPMMLLMNVILIATSLIPLWLFFMITFGLLSLIFIERRQNQRLL